MFRRVRVLAEFQYMAHPSGDFPADCTQVGLIEQERQFDLEYFGDFLSANCDEQIIQRQPKVQLAV